MEDLMISGRRTIGVEWLDRAVNGNDGVKIDSPIYRWVTEGRDPGPMYSSCADLAHWLLMRLGVRLPWINRDEHHGWKHQVNVGRLCAKPVGNGASGCARAPMIGELFQPLDILICWKRPDTTDAHVFVCAEHRETEQGYELVSWDYGQGPMSKKAWTGNREHVEGCRRERDVREIAGRWTFAGGRSIRSVLKLDDVIAKASELGALVDPDLPTNEYLGSRGLVV